MMAPDMDAATAAPRLAEAFPEARRLGDLLRGRGLRVAVAESCTGGLLGAALTAAPGSSDYMLGGVVAYADAVKSAQLGVDAELIRARGAVSEEVARAMAGGVRARLGAELGVAITGVAGPGASEGKPAGLTWVAVAGPGPDALRTRRLDGDQGREGNRAAAVRAALELAEAALAGAGGA
jgi:PncC family amidohydrolase